MESTPISEMLKVCYYTNYRYFQYAVCLNFNFIIYRTHF